MGDFRSLKVWEKAHQLALAVYEVTGGFPRSELYGLTSQMRRSCTSIPANIAEGCGKNSDAELVRFLRIAMGSASELEYHFLLARDLHFLDDPHCEHLASEANEIRRMLAALIHKIKKGQGW